MQSRFSLSPRDVSSLVSYSTSKTSQANFASVPTMGVIPTFGTLVRVLGGVFIVGIASTAGLLYRYQRLLIYPSNFPTGSRQEVMTPDQMGMPYVEEKLKTPDGETVRLYVILQDGRVERKAGRTPSGSGTDAAKSRPTIFLLHANAGNMVRWTASRSLTAMLKR